MEEKFMVYRNFIKDAYDIIDDAHNSIISMFNEKKVKEIEFQMPLSFVVASKCGPELMRFPKIFINNKETIYLVDESGFSYSLCTLVDSIDICKIYDNVYKYFYENVNVKKQ